MEDVSGTATAARRRFRHGAGHDLDAHGTAMSGPQCLVRSRRVALAATGLVLLSATVLAGARVAPRVVGTAAPADIAPAPERDVRDVPDDPRLRDDPPPPR
jgi:hypothetical protein